VSDIFCDERFMYILVVDQGVKSKSMTTD